MCGDGLVPPESDVCNDCLAEWEQLLGEPLASGPVDAAQQPEGAST